VNCELPHVIRRLTWDVEPETVDVKRHAQWLIRRVLGDAFREIRMTKPE
jgi:hypothetical protein